MNRLSDKQGGDSSEAADQALWVKAVQEFCAQEVAPHAAAWDEATGFPAQLAKRLGEQGLLGVRLSEAQGGAGVSWATTVALSQALGAASGALAAAVAVHDEMCIGPMVQGGLAARVPELLAPGCLGGWCASSGVKAEARGDQWLLQGQARGVLGGLDGWLVLSAETTAGPTLFAVQPAAAGRNKGTHEPLMGLRALGHGTVSCVGVTVPDPHRLSAPGAAAEVLAPYTAALRLRMAAVACGVADAGIAAACGYAKDRQQFGQAIAGFQAIQWKLADGHMAAAAATLAVRHAAALLDRGGLAQTQIDAIARAALLAIPAANKAGTDALQIHGGYGYTCDFPIERMLRDARTCGLLTGGDATARAALAESIGRRFAG